ncbi:RCC1 domain-containing protein [Roseateles puraquae]|uniref:RCC1 domain-containing protein n=1 Tax=Roseateles puraquae TaxID=431059 RepID=UPI003CD05C8F
MRAGFSKLFFVSAVLLCSTGGVKAEVAEQLSAGFQHACALTGAGALYCWGHNGSGQLGIGGNTYSTVPVQISTLASSVKYVSAGSSHTCAVMADSTAKCWGLNDYGQLGDNSVTNRSSPVAVSGLAGVSIISAGARHSCALLAAGGVKCWGFNAAGQLGDGTAVTPKKVPTSVLGVSDAVAVAVGAAHTCALRSNGSVLCWGSNTQGQLGTGTTANSSTPVPVYGLANIVEISAGPNHTCAKKVSGEAYCWGSYSFGELGNGISGTGFGVISTPQAVSGLGTTVAQIQAHASNSHTCARLTDGSLYCWGLNSNGQLGTGDFVNYSTPVPVSLMTGVASKLTVGGIVACANVSGLGAMCWGNNSAGSRGSGHTGGANVAEHVVGF